MAGSSINDSNPKIPIRSQHEAEYNRRLEEKEEVIKKQIKDLHHCIGLQPLPSARLLSLGHDFWMVKVERLEKEKSLHHNLYQTGLVAWLKRGGSQIEYDEGEGKPTLDIQAELTRRIHTLKKHASSFSSLALTADDQATRCRLSWLQSFAQSEAGLRLGGRIVKKGSRRDFKSNLIKYWGASYDGNEDRYCDHTWDIISGTWVPNRGFKAGQIFAYMHGQVAMDATFGIGSGDEMFHPANGLWIYEDVEAIIDEGFIVIVPDIPDKSTEEDQRLWALSEPKEYKWKILDKEYYSGKPEFMPRSYGDAKKDSKKPNPKICKEMYAGSPTQPPLTFGELDGRRLIFRNSNRPRARYLYYLYCVNVLRFTWRRGDPAENLLKSQLGMTYWGDPKGYTKTGMIRSFVEETGHLPEEEALKAAIIGRAEASLEPKEEDEDDSDDE